MALHGSRTIVLLHEYRFTFSATFCFVSKKYWKSHDTNVTIVQPFLCLTVVDCLLAIQSICYSVQMLACSPDHPPLHPSIRSSTSPSLCLPGQQSVHPYRPVSERERGNTHITSQRFLVIFHKLWRKLNVRKCEIA
jgi:hypothetical protein